MRHPSVLRLSTVSFLIAFGLAACGGGSGSGYLADGPEQDRIIQATLESSALRAEAEADYQTALTHYVALADERPNDPLPLAAVTRMHRYLGNPGLSRAIAEESLRILGPNRDLTLELAKARLADGDLRAAEATLTELLATHPDDWEVHSLHGILLDRQGQHHQAQATHERAVTLSNRHPQAVNNLALNLAVNGALQEAIALLQEAVLQPRPPLHLHQNLAMFHAYDGNLEEAKAITRRTLPPSLQAERLAWLETLAQQRRPSDLRAGTLDAGPPLTAVPVVPVVRQPH